MESRTIIRVAAFIVTMAGGASLARPAEASAVDVSCLTQLMAAADEAHAFCVSQGYTDSRTSGTCVNGELTSITVTCYNH